jgi:hypothetical protein
VKAGQRQSIVIISSAHVQVHARVSFPDHRSRETQGETDNFGEFDWSFKEPKIRVSTPKRTVHILVTAQRGTGQDPRDVASASSSYVISK